MALVFALLFTVVQASVLLLVDRVGLKIAQERNAQELQVGQRVFLRLLDQNRQRLLQAADVLSRDFAFRQAVATGDAPTISSVLNNHGTRIQANVMLLVSPDNVITADSSHRSDHGEVFPRPALIHTAQRLGKASAIMRIEGGLYQVVVVPVLAPEPIAWVAMGFSIDKSFLEDLRAREEDHFAGPDRLVWASDCPFVGHEGQFPYRATIDWLVDAIPDATARAKIFGTTARELYFNGE